MKLSYLFKDDLDEDGRLNDDMSVSEMSASTFDNESTVGSVKSSTSTIASTSSTKYDNNLKIKFDI